MPAFVISVGCSGLHGKSVELLSSQRPLRVALKTRQTARMVADAPKQVRESMKFLTADKASEVARTFGTPTFVYDVASLRDSATKALAFPHAFGLTTRYAMKAAPNAAILKLLDSWGLHFDCSSGFEVHRAIAAGISPEKLSLSTQELPTDIEELLKMGIEVNACSLSQLERIGKYGAVKEVGVRFNPGLGSGGTGKTNVGGPSSSFGIWFELASEVKELAQKYGMEVIRAHSHIGSGSDPEVWQRVSSMSLDLVRQFPKCNTLNLGGGYKVGRMSHEESTDLSVIGLPVKNAFEKFAEEDGRKLKLEIEPGTFLVANAGSLVCAVQDKTTTSDHEFLKLDTGMTEILRPSLYGSQHPITIIPSEKASERSTNDSFVVVGHCCESGDLVSCAPDEPETIAERVLGATEIGDICVIDGTGAYCSGMSSKNYNSFPEAPEVLLDTSGKLHLIRKKQELSQIFQNEVDVPPSSIAS